MTLTEPQRAAIYVRISDDYREGKGGGVARQEEDCRARALKEGWLVHPRVYRDNDVGASELSKKRRPEYEAMLADARAKKFDLIVAYSNSRLTRQSREMHDLIDLYKETGIELRTIVSGDDDLSKPEGRMMAKIKADIDSAEAEKTGERLRRRQADDRAKGESKGRRPFGWGSYIEDKDNPRRRIVVDRDKLNETEGKALKLALVDIREGVGLAYVVRAWNHADDLSRSSDKPWTTTRVKEILVRWRNAGVLQHQGQPVEGVTGTWEPACTREELDEVRAILLSSERRTTPGRTPSQLLASVAVCGACGRVMYGGRQRTVRKDGVAWFDVYRCSGSHDNNGEKCFLSIKADTLDKIVTGEVRDVLWHGGASALTPTPEERERVSQLRQNRLTLLAEEAKMGELLGSGTVSFLAATSALEGFAKRRTAGDAEIASITSRYALSALFEGPTVEREWDGTDPETRRLVQTRFYFDRVTKIIHEFASLDLSQRREIIRLLLKITVNPGRDPLERVVIERR